MNGTTATINGKQRTWVDGIFESFKKEQKTSEKTINTAVKTKKCSKCGKEFLATEEYFYKNAQSKDGLRNDCIECFKSNRKPQSKIKKDVKKSKGVKQEKIEVEPAFEEITIRINDENIVGIIKDGNNLLPLTELMKAVYGTRHQSELLSIRDELNKFIIKQGTKNYVSLMGLGLIMKSKDDKDLLESITHQALCLPKIKRDPVDALFEGIIGMSNVNNLFKQLGERVKQANNDQSDMLHYLENNELSESEMIEFASNLQILRHKRRDLKNKFLLLDEQITELKNMGFKGASEAGKSVSNLLETKRKLDNAKKHHIYFKKDGSNAVEMEAKIHALEA